MRRYTALLVLIILMAPVAGCIGSQNPNSTITPTPTTVITPTTSGPTAGTSTPIASASVAGTPTPTAQQASTPSPTIFPSVTPSPGPAATVKGTISYTNMTPVQVTIWLYDGAVSDPTYLVKTTGTTSYEFNNVPYGNHKLEYNYTYIIMYGGVNYSVGYSNGWPLEVNSPVVTSDIAISQ